MDPKIEPRALSPSKSHFDLEQTIRASEDIRRQKLSRRRALSLEERSGLSSMICQHISGWQSFQEAKNIAMYAAIGNEVDLWPLIESASAQNKTIYLPRVMGKKLHFCRYSGRNRLIKGPFGVFEPSMDEPVAHVGDIGLFLVPGVAFGWMGNRLGYGKGYYDRGLTDYMGSALTLGVAYGCQMHPRISNKPWDVPVEAIVTEGGVVSADVSVRI